MTAYFCFNSSSSYCVLLLAGKNSSEVVVYSLLLFFGIFLKKWFKVRWLVLFIDCFDALVVSSLTTIMAFFFL